MRASLAETTDRPGPATRPSAQAAFAASLAVVCAVTAYIGIVSPLRSFAHDTFFFLDNAYRVAQGQIPHRDFSSAWGPIMFLVDAAGLRLAGMRADGIGYANALFGGLIAVWAFAIVRARTNDAYGCIAGLFTALLIMAPFPIGEAPSDFGVAMTYNRYGYALFGVLLAECAADMLPSTPMRTGRLGGALSTGVALGLLTFLKISYAVVAIPFVAACWACGAQGRWRRLLAIAAGFVAVSLAFVCYLRFDVSDMLRDLAMAASSRRLSLEPSGMKGIYSVVENAPLLLLAFVAARRLTAAREVRWRVVALAVFTAVAGSLLLATNQQADGFPLAAYAALMIVAADGAWREPGQPRWLAGGILMLMCGLPFTLQNASSLLRAAASKAWPGEPGLVLVATERGGDLAFAPTVRQAETEIAGRDYVAALDDGLDLLARRTGGEGVLAFDMFNPFNYLLGRPSPTGGFAAAAYNYVFSDAVHPSDDRVFGDARYVIVRKYRDATLDPANEGFYQAGLIQVYGPALKQLFTIVEETPHWILWRHK